MNSMWLKFLAPLCAFGAFIVAGYSPALAVILSFGSSHSIGGRW